MIRYYNAVTDTYGNALVGATVTVRDLASTLAVLYSDNGVTPKDNPFTTSHTGAVDFYAADNDYVATITFKGVSFTLPIQLFDLDAISDASAEAVVTAEEALAAATAASGAVSGTVRYSTVQSLSPTEKTQAQTNMGVLIGTNVPPVASPTFTGTVAGVTAAMVGLGNVNNTSDANKPVSTAQQTALDLKAPLASPVFTGNADADGFRIKGAAGTDRHLTFRTVSTTRATFTLTSETETGSGNAGSNLWQNMYSDAGTYLGTSFKINRNSRKLDFQVMPSISGVDLVTDAITDGVTTGAPSSNAVFDALALKAVSTYTVNGVTYRALNSKLTEFVTIGDFVQGGDTSWLDAAQRALTYFGDTGGVCWVPQTSTPYDFHATFAHNKPVTFVALGSRMGFSATDAGSVVFRFTGTSGTDFIRMGNDGTTGHMVGGGYKGINIKSNSLARHTLRITDAQRWSLEDGGIVGGQVTSLLLDNNTATANPSGWANVRNFHIDATETVAANAIHLRGLGAAGQGGVSMIQWDSVSYTHTNGVGLLMDQGDGNLFNKIFGFCYGTGYLVNLRGADYTNWNNTTGQYTGAPSPQSAPIIASTFISPILGRATLSDGVLTGAGYPTGAAGNAQIKAERTWYMPIDLSLHETTISVFDYPAGDAQNVPYGPGADAVAVTDIQGYLTRRLGWIKTDGTVMHPRLGARASWRSIPKLTLDRTGSDTGSGFSDTSWEIYPGSGGALQAQDITAGKTAFSVPKTGGVQVMDASYAYSWTVKPGTFTANRTLTINMGDADRTLDLSSGVDFARLSASNNFTGGNQTFTNTSGDCKLTLNAGSGAGQSAGITLRSNTVTRFNYTLHDGFVSFFYYSAAGAFLGECEAIDCATGIHTFNVSPTAPSWKVSAVQVVGARKTGWTVDTGTSKRTANATYSGTAEALYTQATIQTLMDMVRDLSQTIKALKDDLHGTAGHGLIGT